MSNDRKKSVYPIICPCCGEGAIEERHDICMVCGWEDDEIQNVNHLYAGGANKASLQLHRAIFDQLRKLNAEYMWCSKWK